MPSIFDDIAPRYELINGVLTFGLDRPWRRAAAKVAVLGGGDRWLDICAGTGEMACELRRGGGDRPLIVAADASAGMLHAGAGRCPDAAVARLAADSLQLPFRDHTCDLVTMAFAARNVNIGPGALEACLSEVHRVLRPGGRFVNIETTRPRLVPVRWGLTLYSRIVIERAARLISPAPRGYTYLARTIPTFLPPQDLAEMLTRAGFASVHWRTLTFGVIAVHVAGKSEVASPPAAN